MHALRKTPTLRPPPDSGPIALRGFGPNGGRLGTVADCEEDSGWELHHGELVEQMGSKDIHGVVIALIAALFRTHARPSLVVLTDVYCDLSDEKGPSLRAPDVVLAGGMVPHNDVLRVKPILAVEVRGTQSKKYLEQKVQLYVEHEWPCVWIAHAERAELEVVQPGMAPVVYRPGAFVPLPPELDKYGLTEVPVTGVFDGEALAPYNDGWVAARERAAERRRSIFAVLDARGLRFPDAVRLQIERELQPEKLTAWLALAATATDGQAFAQQLSTSV